MELFYTQENKRYRNLRYWVLKSEATKILKQLFKKYQLAPIQVTFQKKVIHKNSLVYGVFLCKNTLPKRIKPMIKFEYASEGMELLTLLHEFSHYLHFSKKETLTPKNCHGNQFYSLLKIVINNGGYENG